MIICLFSCKDKSVITPVTPPVNVVIDTPNDLPDLPFGAWTSKMVTLPASYDEVPQFSGLKEVAVSINFSKRITKVSKYVNGNNANCFSGWMQNNANLMKNINNLKMGVMRVPGGSLSDVFFWNRKEVYDNQSIKSFDPPIPDIPPIMNKEIWPGKRVESFEDWAMGVDQYYQMMQMTETTGMVTVNYGYARYGTGPNPVAQAAHLAADWVRYDNGRSKFWEIGNEVSGSWEAGYEIDQSLNKDGQPKRITGDLYGRHALVFIDSMRAAAKQIGKEINIGVVCDQEVNTAMPTWNKDLFARVGGKIDFCIVHSYFTPYQANSTPDVILNSPPKVADYKSYVQAELAIQNKPVVPVLLTEWNIFAQGSKQMVSFVAGMHATLMLGELITNKYEAAVRWDLANGYDSGNDHGLFSYGDESGVAKYAPRPAFYYMYFFQKYFGDTMVETTSSNSNVVAYSSQFSSGEAGIVLVNKSNAEQVVELTLKNFKPGSRYYTYILTGGSDNGLFSRKVYVNGATTTAEGGGPENYESLKARSTLINGNIKFKMPNFSVIHLLVEKK
ncbi:MAG: alpha-L-arabinofuranosidase [Bacteroidia bacterium]|nr:alpha-L-arabinofuranosidase [Bacteroidia bacterium]